MDDMNRMLRIASLSLCALVAVTGLVACAEDGDDAVTDDVAEDGLAADDAVDEISAADKAVNDKLNWRNANLTNFESYPTSEEECEDFNGCQWAGWFAFLEHRQTPAWV